MRDNYGVMTIEALCQQLGRSQDSVRYHAVGLGLTDAISYWRNEDLAFVSENMNTMSIEDMALKVGRSLKAVRTKVGELRMTDY